MQPLFEYREAFAGYDTRVLELEGSGPPIVLLHGYADSADTWRLVLDRLARHLRQVSDGDPTDHVVRLAHAYIAFTHANPHLWNLLFEHTLPAGHDLPKWYMDKLNGLLAVIERALEPFFKSGDGEARGRAARVLWSSVHGITSLSTSGKLSIITSEAAPQLAADLVMAYLAGLKSKRKGSSRA